MYALIKPKAAILGEKVNKCCNPISKLFQFVVVVRFVN